MNVRATGTAPYRKGLKIVQRYRLFIAAACACVWILLPGCGEKPTSSSSPAPPAPTAPEKPAPPEASAAAAVAPMPSADGVLINDGAGALNGGFEVWVEGVPLHWQISGTSKIGIAPALDDVREGKIAVKGIPGMYTWLWFYQTIDVKGALAGKTLVLSADVKTPEAASRARVAFLWEGLIARAASEPHPGDGQWHTLVARYQVPPEGLPKGLVIAVGNGYEPKQPCLFDNVKLLVE